MMLNILRNVARKSSPAKGVLPYSTPAAATVVSPVSPGAKQTLIVRARINEKKRLAQLGGGEKRIQAQHKKVYVLKVEKLKKNYHRLKLRLNSK